MKLIDKNPTTILGLIIAAIALMIWLTGCSQPTAMDLKTEADVSLEQIHQAALRGIGLSSKVVEPPELGPEIRIEFENILGETNNVSTVVQQQHERIIWLEEALAKLKGLGWFDYLIYGIVTIGIIIAAWKLHINALYYLATLPTVALLFGLFVSFVVAHLTQILLVLAILVAVVVIAWLNREKLKEWDIIEDLVRHNEKAKRAITQQEDEVIYGKDGEQGLMGTQKDATKQAVKKVKNR
jgi:hypothetical protein